MPNGNGNGGALSGAYLRATRRFLLSNEVDPAYVARACEILSGT
jgi:hypothetical protein